MPNEPLRALPLCSGELVHRVPTPRQPDGWIQYLASGEGVAAECAECIAPASGRSRDGDGVDGVVRDIVTAVQTEVTSFVPCQRTGRAT